MLGIFDPNFLVRVNEKTEKEKEKGKGKGKEKEKEKEKEATQKITRSSLSRSKLSCVNVHRRTCSPGGRLKTGISASGFDLYLCPMVVPTTLKSSVHALIHFEE